jgi:hypothetical protein
MWSITKLECLPSLDGLSDVVVKIFWTFIAQASTDQEIYTGITQVTADPENFTPYANLTKEQVLGWVWSVVDKDATEAMVNKRLQDRLSPPLIDPPLPWE